MTFQANNTSSNTAIWYRYKEEGSSSSFFRAPVSDSKQAKGHIKSIYKLLNHLKANNVISSGKNSKHNIGGLTKVIQRSITYNDIIDISITDNTNISSINLIENQTKEGNLRICYSHTNKAISSLYLPVDSPENAIELIEIINKLIKILISTEKTIKPEGATLVTAMIDTDSQIGIVDLEVYKANDGGGFSWQTWYGDMNLNANEILALL